MTTIPTSPAKTAHTLTIRDHHVLQLADQTWAHVGTKETAIRDRTGYTAPAFYARLDWLIDTHAAIEAYPMACWRARRLRERRAEARRREGRFRAS